MIYIQHYIINSKYCLLHNNLIHNHSYQQYHFCYNHLLYKYHIKYYYLLHIQYICQDKIQFYIIIRFYYKYILHYKHNLQGRYFYQDLLHIKNNQQQYLNIQHNLPYMVNICNFHLHNIHLHINMMEHQVYQEQGIYKKYKQQHQNTSYKDFHKLYILHYHPNWYWHMYIFLHLKFDQIYIPNIQEYHLYICYMIHDKVHIIQWYHLHNNHLNNHIQGILQIFQFIQHKLNNFHLI